MAKLGEITTMTELGRIYNDPDTGLALDLFERFAQKNLNEASFKEFLDKLPSGAAQERAKLEKLLADPNAQVEADLSTRAGQLVWTAGLGFVFQNSPPNTIRSSPVWKTLVKNRDLQNTLTTAARFVDLSIANRDVTMGYGTPGSWFWFAPDKQHVNIDLFHTLLLGFGKDVAPGVRGLPHAIAVILHEIGHAQYTLHFTEKMQALVEHEAAILGLDRTAASQLSPEEFSKRKQALSPEKLKEFRRTRKEYELRDGLFGATEDDCVNRYSVNQSLSFPHDFGKSMNICNVVLQGSGAYMRAVEKGELKKEDDTPVGRAKAALQQINQASMLSFYTTNGLFDVSDMETWKKLGVAPEKIKDFDELMDLCVGPEGIANLQPSARDRWLLRDVFTRAVVSYADRRCKIIDDIWDKYAAQHAKVVIEAAENEPESQKNQNQQDGQGQDSKQQKSQGGKGQSSDQKDMDDPSPSQGSGEGDGGGGEQSQEQDSSLPSTPEQARKEKRRKEEQEAKPGDLKTLRDLLREARQQDRKGKPANDGGKSGQSQDNAPPDLSMDSGNGKGGREKGVDLASLSGGNWSDFKKRINELEPVIARIAGDFAFIRDKQKQTTRSLSKQKEIMPRDGNIMQRLDVRAHMDLAIKRATGQKIGEMDLRRWKKDEVTTESTSVELWILGDGSTSMKQGLPGGGRRIDSAVQSMAILYEAGKRADFDTFVGMWGDNQIRILAAPGDKEQKVGDNFQRVRDGINSGTQLTPSFTQAIQYSAKQETNAHGKAKRFAGMTHFLILSDGELNGGDIEPLTQTILKLFRYGPAVSVDIAVLGDNTGTEMSQVVTAVKAANPAAAIGILNATSAKEIPILLAKKVRQRFEQSAKEVQAIPDIQKREAFSNTYKVINR